MSHCYSVGVDINGKEQEICTVVPGNERIHNDLEAGKKVEPTKDEINRAIEYWLKNHKHEGENPKKAWEGM